MTRRMFGVNVRHEVAGISLDCDVWSFQRNKNYDVRDGCMRGARDDLTAFSLDSMSMDEVSPGLWIGDLPGALDVDNLRARGIFSILSAMRRIKEVRLSLTARFHPEERPNGPSSDTRSSSTAQRMSTSSYATSCHPSISSKLNSTRGGARSSIVTPVCPCSSLQQSCTKS